MSTYELDEHDVEVILQQLRERGSGMAREIAERLEAQIPIDEPTKLGAVVMTEGELNGGIYIRWIQGSASASPWILAREHETPYRTDEIGRIVKVLAEGVDQP